MEDVNYVTLKVGQKVIDVSVSVLTEQYGPPDEIVELTDDTITLDNDKVIKCNAGCRAPVKVI